ncbi:hypothetical protein TNCV_3285981, partial [Trichonephila clavipes]
MWKFGMGYLGSVNSLLAVKRVLEISVSPKSSPWATWPVNEKPFPFQKARGPKAIKSACKDQSGPPAALTGESTKLPFVFEAVREIYRSIFGVASFEKVDRFRSEIQLAGHPVRG